MHIRNIFKSIIAASLVTTSLVAPTNAASNSSCHLWQQKQVASGFASLENLAFDGRGGLLLSEGMLKPGSIKRLTSNGNVETVVSGVPAPGGIVVDGDDIYFNAGNSTASGVLGTRDGAIKRVKITDSKLPYPEASTFQNNLIMPNGLAKVSGVKSFVVSRNTGSPTGITMNVSGLMSYPYAPQITSANGLAWDSARNLLWVSTAFNPTTQIFGIDPWTGATVKKFNLAGIGTLNAADDLTVGPDGKVYVALNLAGKIVQIDPATGATCNVAIGLPLSSSVRFGNGPGWDPNAAYVTSFLGTVTRLTS